MPRTLVASLLLVAATAVPSIAHADPVVVVELGPSSSGEEATVVLADADRVVGSCQTRRRTCVIQGVGAGRYYVSARAADGRETPPRPVMLPEQGSVRLVVAAP